MSHAGPGQPFTVPLAAALGVPVYPNAETCFPMPATLPQKVVQVGAVMHLVTTSVRVNVVPLGGHAPEGGSYSRAIAGSLPAQIAGLPTVRANGVSRVHGAEPA